jgi:CheY-like chemotaxis protein
MVAILSIAVTGVATAAAFVFVRKSAADTQTRHLAEYVGERVKTEDRLFSDLVKVHDAAGEALTRRLAMGDDPEVHAQFNRLFPEKGDGTRRSVDGLFNGARIGNRYVYGIGGYLPDANTMSLTERQLFVAATDVVAAAGETEIRHYDNFYFFTPKTRLVMFGPNRPDKLLYYRHDAPAHLSIAKEEMTLLTLPENNPERVMKCTKLRRLISDPSGRGLNAACLTPFYYKGQFMGAFGTSLSLDSYLLRAVADALPGGQNLIVADDGELVGAQGLSRNGAVDAGLLRKFEAENDLKGLVATVRAQKRDVGTILTPKGDRLVAYGRLVEPGWWFLMTFPSGDIVWSSLKTASWVLLFGFIGVALQVLLLYRLTNQMVAAPLEALAEAQRRGDPAAAEAKHLVFRWSVASDAEGTYDGDSGRISQILSNLLANAVKFTGEGGVSLEVDRVDDKVRFVVSDTGVGFDEAVRERLFKRFVQADQSITRQFGGTGLGLSICAALAEMMGGRIRADAKPGQGARFEVLLPLSRCANVAETAIEEDREISLEGMRVLVAEDHPTNRKVVQIVLEPFGVDLTMVGDGEAALKALDEASFDAVLMDMQMPIMDGLSATRAIRAREAASGAPPILVVMLTANAMEEHVAAAEAAGANLHLAKPLHPAQLLEALARARKG